MTKILVLLFWLAVSTAFSAQAETNKQVADLIAAMLGDTPLEEDLTYLTQTIGGRATGTAANRRSVDWALQRLLEAGVAARKETFVMPDLWLENSASAKILGEGVSFNAALAAMPFSDQTPARGLTAALVDVGAGSADDFARLGNTGAGTWMLVETELLTDVDGLFREYAEAYQIERRAHNAQVAGLIYMSSRAPGALYRHNASLRGDDSMPMAVMERDAARRTLDLLRNGVALDATVFLDLNLGPAYESDNVIAELPGTTRADEIVVVGAHLDSWDLGTGTLDNGANVVLLMDLARQIIRLGINTARTVRFVLWNGEEQGMYGSLGYTRTHANSLNEHVIAMSIDIGCGRINGFFTGGRPEVFSFTEGALAPVRGLGPFLNLDVPIVGTDNYDFMMEGVANLVGNQEPATYGPNYHASTDQLDECDLRTLRLNGAIIGAVTLAFADAAPLFDRQSRAELEALIEATDLETEMRNFNLWESWADGTRGRSP